MPTSEKLIAVILDDDEEKLRRVSENPRIRLEKVDQVTFVYLFVEEAHGEND